MDYKASGVDVDAGRSFVERIKSSVEATHTRDVLGGLGGFGGCISISKEFEQPVLVAGTDGVGTKLELAQDYGSHFGVGIDLVAMCVNDVITNGAKPLFFLDYIATGALTPAALAEVVEGIADGCCQSGCSLLGGETAEMPGFYSKGRYDLAGFCVGIIDRSKLIDGKKIQIGDSIIAVQSNGIHSNGYSLVRKVLETVKATSNTRFGTGEDNLIEKLLEPTFIYSKLVNAFVQIGLPIRGMSHITGGGLPENLPRSIPKGLQAVIDCQTWKVPEIFSWLQDMGTIPEKDLWNTFNMGVGFCVVVPPSANNSTLELCRENGFESWVIGEIQECPDSRLDGLVGLPF